MEDLSLLFKLTDAQRRGEASDSSGLSRKHLLLKKLSQMQRIKKKKTRTRILTATAFKAERKKNNECPTWG